MAFLYRLSGPSQTLAALTLRPIQPGSLAPATPTSFQHSGYPASVAAEERHGPGAAFPGLVQSRLRKQSPATDKVGTTLARSTLHSPHPAARLRLLRSTIVAGHIRIV